MIKEQIEEWFINKVREFTLNPDKSKLTFISLINQYNQEYLKHNIQEERRFNPIIFAHLLTKIRTIGFSIKVIENEEFILFRNLLIRELNYYNREIALDFIKIISNENIVKYKTHKWN